MSDRVPEPLIEAHGVTLTRHGRRILHCVDLHVAAGELVAVVGPNGAGKSTLVGVLAGDLRPEAGVVRLGGRPLGEWRPGEMARQRAVLPQDVGVGFPFSVREVVSMGRTPWRGSARPDEDVAAVHHAMEVTGTLQLADRSITTLSGGERRRVGIARVLAQTTPLLLLDEPTAALDIAHQEHLLRLLRRCVRDGQGILVVLHDLALAAAYGDRVVILDGGTVAATGPPQLALSAELLSRIYRHPISVECDPAGHVAIRPHRDLTVLP